MIKAIISDFFGVLLLDGTEPNRQLLDYIRSQLKPKYKISILSNASRDHAKELFTPADYRLFDDVITSFAHGSPKPETAIYELAAERLKLLPGQCVFTDDTQVHCDGAESAGMQAILYEDFESFKENLERLLTAGPDN